MKLCDSSSCVGCCACLNICSQKAIQMTKNKFGELLPSIDMKKCIECGACRRIVSSDAIALNPSTLTALRHTIYADDDKLFSFSLSQEGLNVLNLASESYLKYRFEKDFKTLNFYKTISRC